MAGALGLVLGGAQPAHAQDSIGHDAEGPSSAAAPLDPKQAAAVALAHGDTAEALAKYLRALASDPRDLEALTGAGHAALDLDDPEAAIAFYARAEEVSPRNGRVKAGLGSAMVRQRNPRAALRFFADAVELGVPPSDIAADRGLAYDLRGDNRRAQAEYQQALAARPDPETTRRLALSQAMAGNREAALATLDPLLRRQDIPAWRTRAFVLAIVGDADEAEKGAAAVMPRAQAEALAPYLRRIGTLKPAEKAAAVNFGYLPPAPAGVVPVKPAVAQQVAAQSAAPSPAAREPLPLAYAENHDPAHTRVASLAADRAALAAALAGRAIAPPPPTIPPPGTARSFDLATVTGARVAAEPAPRPAPEGDARAVAQQDAAAAKALAAKAKAEKLAADKAAKANAEKLAQAAAEKAEAAKQAKIAKANPERYWVQVAGGARKSDLDKAWAGVKSKNATLFAGRSPWTIPFRHTNRLMIGPFKSDDAAQDFVNTAAKSGVTLFTVHTAAGDVVEKVPLD